MAGAKTNWNRSQEFMLEKKRRKEEVRRWFFCRINSQTNAKRLLIDWIIRRNPQTNESNFRIFLFRTYRRVEELLELWVLSNDLGVEALGNVEHLRGDGGGGRDDHVDGLLGHGFGESHSFAGSLAIVGEGGDDAVLVHLGGVRIGGGGLGGNDGAGAGFSGDGALGFGHLVCCL
jgi:hypothetical protein